MQNTHRGFTLVELSIVLVILGLLVGGTLTGQSLIRASELRSVTTQLQGYQTAAHAFRDKYFGLPGDLTNATAFWGAAHATPATCVTTVGTGTQTCDTNGNGRITPSTTSNEVFRFWQQLVNAGLIAGKFTGVSEGGTWGAGPSNAPTSKISNAYFYINYTDPQSNASTLFDGNYGNSIHLGGYVSGGAPLNPVMKAEDVWNIDTKMDDGKPATGKIRIWGTLADCTDTSLSSNMAANYSNTNTAITCKPYFVDVF